MNAPSLPETIRPVAVASASLNILSKAVLLGSKKSEAQREFFVAPFMRLRCADLRTSMRRALGTLDQRAREAILRKHVLGESYKEIARALFGPRAGETQEGHVSVILTRARQRLREVLGDEAA